MKKVENKAVKSIPLYIKNGDLLRNIDLEKTLINLSTEVAKNEIASRKRDYEVITYTLPCFNFLMKFSCGLFFLYVYVGHLYARYINKRQAKKVKEAEKQYDEGCEEATK